MGGTQLCNENDDGSVCALLDSYIEHGGNFIDTANVYGKWLPGGKSVSEINIGKWMMNRKNRYNLIIATKGGHPNLETMHASRVLKKDVAADMEESMKSLQIDYIDFYWLHRDNEAIPAGEIIEYLNEFVREGKIRYFGCSNWKPARINEALAYAKQNKLLSFSGNQMLWNLAKLNDDPFDDKTMVAMDAETYSLHLTAGMTAIPYTSQAGGFFDKLDKQDSTYLSNALKKAYFNEENILRLERIKALGLEMSVSITQTVLAYLLSQPFTTIPILGCRNIHQLMESMKAVDLVLPADALSYLDGGLFHMK